MRRLARLLRAIGIAFGALIGVATAAGLVLQRCSPSYRPSGDVVNVEGARLHIDCAGEARCLPTLVAETGLGMNAQAFYWLQRKLEGTARFCRYDRAGMGFSSASDGPKDADTVARQLHALLHVAQIQPPYLMVGHSLGGSYIRVFADRYSDEVMGLVLLDSTHPRQLDRMRDRSTGQRAGCSERSLSPPTWVWSIWWCRSSAGLQTRGCPSATVNRAFYRTGKDLRATAQELAASPAIFARTGRTKPLATRPVLVFTAAEQPADTKAAWMDMQHELALLSVNGQHFVVPNANHVSLITREANADFIASKIRELYPGFQAGSEWRPHCPSITSPVTAAKNGPE